MLALLGVLAVFAESTTTVAQATELLVRFSLVESKNQVIFAPPLIPNTVLHVVCRFGFSIFCQCSLCVFFFKTKVSKQQCPLLPCSAFLFSSDFAWAT